MDKKKYSLGNMDKIISYLQIIILIIGIGVLCWLFANQISDYIYRTRLLDHPCDVCLERVPIFEDCFKSKNTIINTSLTIPTSLSSEKVVHQNLSLINQDFLK